MTEARDEILARVRAAITDAPMPVLPPTPVGAQTADPVAHFAERVADYRAVVERCGVGEVLQRVLAALPEGRVVVPSGLSVDVPDAVVDDGMSATQLDACVAVVTDATVARRRRAHDRARPS